ASIDSTQILKKLQKDISEPIQNTTPLLVLDNLKMGFLILYVVIAILFIVYMNYRNRKKINNHSITFENQKKYFIEKVLLDADPQIDYKKEEHPMEKILDEKELMSC